MNARPWMVGTPLPADLVAEVRDVVEALRAGAGPRRERAARASAVVVALGDAALRHHFVAPLARIGVGAVARKTVDVAIAAVVRGIGGPVRTVIGGLDETQLARVADELEVILYPDPHG